MFNKMFKMNAGILAACLLAAPATALEFSAQGPASNAEPAAVCFSFASIERYVALAVAGMTAEADKIKDCAVLPAGTPGAIVAYAGGRAHIVIAMDGKTWNVWTQKLSWRTAVQLARDCRAFNGPAYDAICGRK